MQKELIRKVGYFFSYSIKTLFGKNKNYRNIFYMKFFVYKIYFYAYISLIRIPKIFVVLIFTFINILHNILLKDE